jgi:hypothetical protein
VGDPAPAGAEDQGMTSAVLHRAAGWNRPLLILTAGAVVLTVITAVGTFADPRVLTGAPIWLKPFKFSVSFVLYGLTLAWMLSLLPRRSRLAEWSAVVILGTAVVEMAIIVTQVVRGETSHFNYTTPLNAMLFNIMGAAIMVLFLAHFLIGYAVLRQRIADRVAATGVKLGLAVSLVGLLAAVPMVIPSPEPGVGSVAGAHSVGVADGGPGLPVVGWSTAGGDYRIGHFVGLHALQALPLLAFLLARFAGMLSERTKVGLLLVAGLAYTLLTVLLTWQASRGQSLIHPDALTLAAVAVLAAMTATAASLVVRRGRRDELALAA